MDTYPVSYDIDCILHPPNAYPRTPLLPDKRCLLAALRRPQLEARTILVLCDGVGAVQVTVRVELVDGGKRLDERLGNLHEAQSAIGRGRVRSAGVRDKERVDESA